MSSAGSVQQQLTTVTVFDSLGQNGYNMFVTGGVYHTSPTLANDGESQSLNVNEAGEMRVSGPVPDNVVIPAYADPVWMGGQYNTALPTYDNTDLASFQMDINGRQLTRAMGYDADNAASAASTAPVRVGGNYFAALPTYDNADQVTFQHDVNGRLLVREDTLTRGAGSVDADTLRVTISDDTVAIVQGQAADNAAAVQNPVLIAGIYEAALPTYDNADVATPHTDVNGRLLVREDTLTRGGGSVDANTLRVTIADDTVNIIQGRAADNAGAVDNPVLIGGQFNATPPTYDDGDVANLQQDVAGNLRVVKETPQTQTLKNAQITVGTTQVRLTHDAGVPDADRSLLQFRPDPASVARFFYGATGVTTGNGIEIFPGELIELLDDADDYFIISDTAAQTVGVLEKE